MRSNAHGRPIVAIDIDGTLGDYHSHFTRFASQWLGRDLPSPNRNTGGVPLYRWLGISKATYRQCKLAYRQGGMKRSMPAYPYADEAIRAIRRNAQVWICTTRPYLRLDNIDPDTRHWLRRNHITYDGVLFGEHKYHDLAKIVGRENVAAVVDDLPPMIQVADALGMPTILRDQPYNRLTKFQRYVVWDMYGMELAVMKLLTEWKDAHNVHR